MKGRSRKRSSGISASRRSLGEGAFVVLSMPRTGSTFLVTSLDQHPDIKAHGELFHPNYGERAGSHAIRIGNNQIFYSEGDDAIRFLREEIFLRDWGVKRVGFKLHGDLVRTPGTERIFSRLKEEFPLLRYIHISRPNYLDVLISKTVAQVTKRWVAFSEEHIHDTRLVEPVKIDAADAKRFFDEMRKVDGFFSDFFFGAHYHRVLYDNLADNFTSTLSSIHGFLGVARQASLPQTKKQISSSPATVVANYAELAKHFARTPYAVFFGGNEEPPER